MEVGAVLRMRLSVRDPRAPRRVHQREPDQQGRRGDHRRGFRVLRRPSKENRAVQLPAALSQEPH